jgi:hypothetical protein
MSKRLGLRSRFAGLTAIAALAATALVVLVAAATAGTPVSGAIFTTDSACSGVDLNIYSTKLAVYVDGGPAHPGAAGLPDGSYYVQVTAPDGTLLGTSVGSGSQTPVHVTDGAFDTCYQLWAILIKASDATTGYDDTPNPGGEYKVWISTVSTFDNDQTKTDNFKVNAGDTECDPSTETCGPPPQSTLNVIKFYDANANGINDDGQPITGWNINIHDGMTINETTPVSVVVAPDDYVVTEGTPIQSNWFHTTPNPVNITVADGGTGNVEFGNLCVGAGGGLTLGFWSNKNGQALVGSTDLAMLVALNLRNANGSTFDPATAKALATWLLNATATNMAYMLSAQLAAMELNVFNGFVDGTKLVYVGGTINAFWTVNALMAAANTSLGLNGNTTALSADRTYQETLKTALDKANNNLNFVQGTPCVFSFAS